MNNNNYSSFTFTTSYKKSTFPFDIFYMHIRQAIYYSKRCISCQSFNWNTYHPRPRTETPKGQQQKRLQQKILYSYEFLKNSGLLGIVKVRKFYDVKLVTS